MATCKVDDCPLHGRRVVPYAGNLKAKVMAVGESPGNKEVSKGTPFYEHAPAGKKVRELSKLAGLAWDKEVFVTNAARCMILKDKMKGKDITKTLACCRKYVKAAVNGISPKVILVFGDIALQQVLKKKGIRKARGNWAWSDEFQCWVMPTYHPAYILRNQALAPLVVGDIKQVRDFLDNDCKPIISTESPKYIEVQTLRPFLDKAKDKPYQAAIDTEGQGLDWMDPNFLLISYSISFKKETGVNVTLFEECPEGEQAFTITWMRPEPGKKKKIPTPVFVKMADNFERKVEELGEFLACKNIKKYMTNGNYDVHAFRWLFRRFHGRPPIINRYVMDIQSASHLIDETIYQLANLTMLQRNFTDFKGDYKGEFAKTHDKADMLDAQTRDPEGYRFYAVADSDVTLRVGKTIRNWMIENSRQGNYLVKMVMPTLHTLMLLEENGALIDQEQLPIVEAEIIELMEDAETKAFATVPKAILEKHAEKLKLTRRDLIRDILFDDDGFGLEPLKKTKDGTSVDKEVRKGLLDRPLRKKVREFIIQYDLWSEYHTLLTRYIRGFQKWIRCDGRIHTKYSLCIAVTGRVSSRDPNMMNNPKRSKSAEKIRKLIIAPPGYKLVAADESQSELRWLAHVANEKEMIRIFRNASLDIHTETASLLVTEKWSSLSEDQKKVYRRNAKAVNFGLIFGMLTDGFIRYCKLEYGIDLTRQQAESWISAYFTKYGGVRRYHRKAIDACRRNGYVESPLGRRRHLPEINSYDGSLRAEAERQGINHPIQSPSSDTVLIAANEITKANYPFEEIRPILFIHDELIFEVREDKVNYYAKIIKKAMENPPLERDFDVKLKVPLVAEIKVGDNLAEMAALKI